MLSGLVACFVFESPRNPHAGCFVLSRASCIIGRSSLTGKTVIALGCLHLRVLRPSELPKPFVCSSRSWRRPPGLEIQHWGTSFHCLLGDKVALPDDQTSPVSDVNSEASTADQDPN